MKNKTLYISHGYSGAKWGALLDRLRAVLYVHKGEGGGGCEAETTLPLKRAKSYGPVRHAKWKQFASHALQRGG